MIRKLFFSTLVCLGLHTVSLAQQDPLYSQYMFNMMGINPAYAGSRELLSITAMGRYQWAGVNGAPVSHALNADFALPSKKVGLGFQVSTDKIGVTNTTGFTGTYAYRLKFKKGVIAMGLQGGFSAFKANYTSVELTGNDNAFASNVNMFKPTFGAGVYYNTDKFYLGVSVPHLLHYSTYSTTDHGEHTYYQSNHWLFAAGYAIDLSKDIVLKPSILLRVVQGAPLNADFNANLWFYQIASVGVSVRTGGMVIGMLEFQASKQFRFGYAYDYTTVGNFPGSHEFMLRYEFGFEKKRTYSPRYF